MADRKEEATIQVPTEGGGPPPESKEPQLPAGPNPELVDDKKGDDLSAEDRALKERLDLAVERTTDADAGIILAALEALRREIRGATASMTSVPKPFKFLAPHFAALRATYSTPRISGGRADVKRLFADILSVLAMTMGKPGARECLGFKLAGNREDIGDWGAEYVRQLAGEIGQEWQARLDAAEAPAAGGAGAGAGAGAAAAAAGAAEPAAKAASAAAGASGEELLALVRVIIPFDLRHNAEVEAVDLLLEVEQLDMLNEPGLVDEASHGRVGLYLLKCADYLGDVGEAEHTQAVAFNLYLAHKQFTQALVTGLRMGGPRVHERVDTVFAACADAGVRKQLGHLLGRHRLMGYIAHDEEVDAAIGNASLATLFAALGKDLDTLEPKAPEDIYKSHLTGGAERGGAGAAAGAVSHACIKPLTPLAAAAATATLTRPSLLHIIITIRAPPSPSPSLHSSHSFPPSCRCSPSPPRTTWPART